MIFLISFIFSILMTSPDDEIVVVGKRKHSSYSIASEKSSSGSVTGVKSILKSGLTIGDALSLNPGIEQKTTGGIGHKSYLMIRGSSPSQVTVFLDGFKLPGSSGGAVDLSGLPLTGISKIEVFTGGVPAELGLEGIGGAVNLIPLIPGKQRYGAYYTLGSFGTLRNSIIYGRGGEFPYILTGSFSTSLGNYKYFSNNGTEYTTEDDSFSIRKNNHTFRGKLFGVVSRYIWSGVLRAYAYGGWSISGVPGPASIITTKTENGSSRALFAIKYEKHEKKYDIEGRCFVSGVLDRYSDPLGEIGVGTQNLKSDTFSLGVSTLFNYKLTTAQTLKLIPAIIHESYKSHDFIKDIVQEENNRLNVGGGVKYRYKRKSLFFQTSIQYMYMDENSFSTGNHSFYGLRAGFYKRFFRFVKIRGNYSDSFRIPSFVEKYGNSGALKGNPDLVPEKSRNLESGIELVYKGKIHGRLRFSGFYKKVENLIQYVPNSQFIATAQNISSAKIKGFESLFNINFKKIAGSELSFTYLDPINSSPRAWENGKMLPGRWKYSFLGKIWWRIKLKKWDLTAHYRFSYYRSGFFDASERRPMPRRTFHDLFLSVQTPYKELSLSLECRNLSNHLYEMVERLPKPATGDLVYPQSISNYIGYPLPGRTIFFNISFEH